MCFLIDGFCGYSQPVILTGAMEFWPALGRAAGLGHAWKDVNYLRRVAGLRTVPIEVQQDYNRCNYCVLLVVLNAALVRWGRATWETIGDKSL